MTAIHIFVVLPLLPSDHVLLSRFPFSFACEYPTCYYLLPYLSSISFLTGRCLCFPSLYFFSFCAIPLSRRHLKSGYVWMRSFGNVEFTNGLALCDFNISSGFTVGLGNGLEKRILPCHLAHMIRQPCCLKAFVQVQLLKLPAIQ